MATKVTIDFAALKRHFDGPETQTALDYVIDVLEDNAIEATPEKTGYARKKFVTRKPASLKRRLVSLDPFFHLIEWGSINNRAYAPIRRAVSAAGLKLSQDSKP